MADSKTTLATQCYENLSEAILNGDILPGEKLLCEELKQRFGVGMSTVREALAKLAANQLATFEEHKGYMVAKLSASQLKDRALTFAEIECLCLKLAMEYGDVAWEGRILAALHCLKKVEMGHKVPFSVWAPLNAQFHHALVSACPFHALLAMRDQQYQLHQWVILLSYKRASHDIIRANHEEHEQMGKATIARKSQEACHKLYAHLTGGIEELIAGLKTRNLIHEN